MNKRIRILSTSDLHGYIYPYSYADGKEMNYGLARIKTMIDELRDENTILIDNGDTIEGSPLTFHHYLTNKEGICPISKAMKVVDYDYVNVGNHDFNYGLPILKKHLDYVGAQCITNNVVYEDGTALDPKYVIHEIAGKTLAIFGLTTHFIPRWEKPENIEGLSFPDALESAKKTLAEIKEKENADYIICVYHGGFENDPATGVATEEYTGEGQAFHMVEEIEGIDILIAGHQHRQYCGTLKHTAYTEPAFNGQFLSCIDIDTESGEITPTLLPATKEADKEILALVQKEEDACQKWLDQTLGTTNVNLHIDDEDDARIHKSQLITFLNKVQMDVTGADISASALFLRATGFQQEITMRHIVSTYPFPNTLVLKKVTGKILREYLEKDLEFWAVEDGKLRVNPLYDFPNPQHHNYDMLDGIEYRANISLPVGHRLTSLTRNGIEIQDEDEFKLVINNYRASGGGNFFMLRDAETLAEYQESMVDILANYILKHKIIDFEPIHNIVISL